MSALSILRLFLCLTLVGLSVTHAIDGEWPMAVLFVCLTAVLFELVALREGWIEIEHDSREGGR